MEDTEVVLTKDEAFNKAHAILKVMQETEKENHALILMYNPEKEAFQMVAINSDTEEVLALILSGLATVRTSIKDLMSDRTIN